MNLNVNSIIEKARDWLLKRLRQAKKEHTMLVEGRYIYIYIYLFLFSLSLLLLIAMKTTLINIFDNLNTTN